MRFFLCAAALLLPSVARGEPIEITGVIANYDTASDELFFEVEFDRPFVLGDDYLGISAVVPTNAVFGAANGTARDPADMFSTVRFVSGQGAAGYVEHGPISHALGDDSISLMVADATVKLASWNMTQSLMYHVSVRSDFDRLGIPMYDTWHVFSTVDDPRFLRNTPEPSSFALLLVGSIVLLHRLNSKRTPRANRLAGFRCQRNQGC